VDKLVTSMVRLRKVARNARSTGRVTEEICNTPPTHPLKLTFKLQQGHLFEKFLRAGKQFENIYALLKENIVLCFNKGFQIVTMGQWCNIKLGARAKDVSNLTLPRRIPNCTGPNIRKLYSFSPQQHQW
jgi:hypothetical protein